MARLLSRGRDGRPHLAAVTAAADDAFATMDRVAPVADYVPAVAYPNDGLGLALQAVAGAMVTGVGSRVFWVETGGFDTHAGQGTNGGLYATLMQMLDAALLAFHGDLTAQGLWNDTLLLQCSEFGRQHHGERQPRHRSWRGVGDAGHGRHGPRRSARHRRVARPGQRQPGPDSGNCATPVLK